MSKGKRTPMTGNAGQVLPYALIMMIVLVISWAMILNIAKLLKDRIMMQNAADNAALSVTVLKARTLNLIGATNYLMATVLSSGSYPFLKPISTFSLDHVGGSPSSSPLGFCDVKCRGTNGEYSIEYGGVNKIRFTVNRLANLQKALVMSYTVNSAAVAAGIARRQEKNSKGEYSGADIAFSLPADAFGGDSLSNPSFWSGSVRSFAPESLLGIERNRHRITYFKTINIGANTPDHHHFVWHRKWLEEESAWYTGNERFPQQKIVVVALKRSIKGSSNGYPVLKNLLGISWPSIITVSAAAPYNTCGPMLPLGHGTITGLQSLMIFKVAKEQAKQIIDMYTLANEVSTIPAVGQVVGPGIMIGAGAIETYAIASLAKAKFDDDTPIRRYETADQGGWDAHLVPVNEGGIRH